MMNRQITDEMTGIGYTLQDDYYLPDLALPAEEEQYRILYYNLLTSCKLNDHLADITLTNRCLR